MNCGRVLDHMKNKLKAYIAFFGDSRHEAAALVIAHTAKDAKLLAWHGIDWISEYDEYLDLRVNRIWNDCLVHPLADQRGLAEGKPHVIDDPPGCASCFQWGSGIDDEKKCGSCGGYPGARVIEAYTITN